ncbi:MAG: sulfatase-like hydrolase/transferase [Allosphingosinicella sp.]|uniref:sulfatase-like hydrolase/transferase n=1 Tax=Allosphingosinicella sp. TaxID=2823234 RepID=UPI003952BC79
MEPAAALPLPPATAPRARRRHLSAAALTVPAVAFLLLLVELALAERKFAIFGGGFGQPRALDTPLEIGAFLAALVFCQLLLFQALFLLLRRLHGRRGDNLIFLYNFAWIAGFGGFAVLIAKYQALSYFSDAMSFQIVRNLGGGSLFQAALYVMSEAGLLLMVTAGAAGFYLAGLMLLRRRWPGRTVAAPPLGWRSLAAACLLLPFLLFAAMRVEDSRAALPRFNAPWLFTAILHQATDVDRDGWSWFSHPIDAHPFDPARYPYALDMSAPAPADAAALPSPVLTGAKPHVILIVLESARGDLIGKRVNGRPVAPVIEAIAHAGSSAPEAYSHVGFTTHSLQSLFSGMLAPADDSQSLFRDFAANGYRVGVLSAQPEDFGDTARISGMRRFASVYVDAADLKHERAFGFTALASLAVEGKVLLREFDRHWGSAEAWSRPNFLYMNLQSAHFPYHMDGMDLILTDAPVARREIKPANREQVERTYWNALANNDRLVAALIERLKRLGVLDDTLLVITSDHGESLFEDGFLGHGHMLNRVQTHIPFILSRPGIDLPRPIGLSDMRGIILSAAGAPPATPRGPRRVFQYLGTLERPGAIGFVEPGGAWTILNLGEDEVWTSAKGAWVRRSELGRAEADRIAALESEWNRERRLRIARAELAAR